METPAKLSHSSLRTKVMVPMITVLVVMLVMTVWFVDYRIDQQIETDARQSLSTDDTSFRILRATHLNDLNRLLQSLAKEPKNFSAFGTFDFGTITNRLHAILEEEGLLGQTAMFNENVAFLLFTPEMETAGNSGPMIQPATASAAFPAAAKLNINRALHGDRDTPQTLFDTAAVDGKLYNVISVCVFSPEHVLFGVLTVGEEIGLVTAKEYGKPIIFMAEGRPVESTLSTLPPQTVLDNAAIEALFQRVNASGGIERVSLGKSHNYFCTSDHFPSQRENPATGYLLFHSYDPTANTLETQQLLLYGCVLAILAGSACVRFFVNRALQPLRELRDSAEAVGRGDFSRRVQLRSRDECGALAVAFNQMTENVQQAQAQLQKTVNTLKSTQAQLVQSEKLSAVGEFVAGVAHELNNPLAAVMGFSEMLKDADVHESHRRHLDLIFQSATRCRKIVQSLLSFARRHQPERKPVAVNKLIEEVLEIVAYQLRTSNVEVNSRFAPNLPLVLADGHQIQQVILNLVNNARQAIEGHQQSGRITVSTELQSKAIRISIQDNGPGIAPENLSRIFDPFFTTKEVGKGTGLGLSLCYGLIREHGGTIAVNSQPGQGACFIIELPATDDIAPAESPLPAKAENIKSQEGAGKKILLVDDEHILLEMIREGLKRHSYEVTTANNGEAALRQLHDQKFDAVCTDLKMPGLNGRQLYEWIRASRPDAARRIVFMTGDIINESLQMFLDQERLACLHKPFAVADLRQAIKKIIQENNGR
jgi:signal transduction histidine kinase/ActR/RegA family two-component response regulator